VLPAPHRRYHAVAIAAWDCLACTGDAAASWSACRQGASGLQHAPELGWHGAIRAIQGPGRMLAIAHRAALRPWQALSGSRGLPALIVGSSKGDPQLMAEALAGDAGALPAALPGALSARLAADLGIAVSIGAAPAAACSTGLYAVLEAADLIERGACTHALAGAADCALATWLLAGFRSLGVLCGDRSPQAFAEPTGFAPAEGAGFLALAAAGPWRLRGGVRLGDARHPTRFEDGDTLARALLALWEILPAPELIVTHGTGTASGDAYEAGALDDGPWAACARLHCKPVIGHCLGASGAVELALALESPVDRIWKLSLGFGGHLAALALERSR
jgi:3-oxoacyl-[acyl-carrier-protein] synthase II